MPRLNTLKGNRDTTIEDSDPIVDLSKVQKYDWLYFRNGQRLQVKRIDRNYYNQGNYLFYLFCGGYHLFTQNGIFTNFHGWFDPLERPCSEISSDDYHGWDIVRISKEGGQDA